MDLWSERKLTKILQSKSNVDIAFSAGDKIKVFVHISKHKHSKWTSLLTVLSFDTESWTVTVPSAKNKTMKAAIENVRTAAQNEEFGMMVRQAKDELNDVLQFVLSNISLKRTRETINDGHNSFWHESGIPLRPDDSHERWNKLNVGDNISVYCPLMNSFYNGRVHQINNDKHVVHYEDGGMKRLNLDNENWMFCAASFSARNKIESARNHELNKLFNYFGNRSFMRFGAQAFPRYLFAASYGDEIHFFKKTVKETRIQDPLYDGKTIHSHVLCKIKVSNNMSLNIKARIAPHGNKNFKNNEFRSDCTMCSAPESGILCLLHLCTDEDSQK